MPNLLPASNPSIRELLSSGDDIVPSGDAAALRSLHQIGQSLKVVGSLERPIGSPEVTLPEVIPWFLGALHDDARGALDRAASSGTRCYISGSRRGAGTTTLLQTYAALYNMRADEDQRFDRIIYMRLTSGLNRPRKFLDTLMTSVSLRLNNSDQKLGNTASALETFFAEAARLRVRALFIDQVDQVEDDIRKLLVDLCAFTRVDNVYRAIGDAELLSGARFGLAFGGRWSYDDLARRSPLLADEVCGDRPVIAIPQTSETIQEILTQTGVLHPSACESTAFFVEVADELLLRTGGMPHNLRLALRHILVMRRRYEHEPFNRGMFDVALGFVAPATRQGEGDNSSTSTSPSAKPTSAKKSKPTKVERAKKRQVRAAKAVASGVRHKSTILS